MVRSTTLLAVTACALLTGCRLERPGFADSIAQRDAERAHTGPACGVSDSTALSGAGIGDLRPGTPLDSVRRGCQVISQAPIAVTDGRSTSTVRVDVVRDTVTAELSDGLVSRLSVRGAGIRTREGYGVNSTLEQLMHWSDLTSATTDGSLFVMSPSHCGMSFRLAGPAPVPPSPQSGVKALKHTPGEVRVSEVLIYGCRNTVGPAPEF
jgi:hypothetical protein